jgi:hypothetical protein
VVLFEGDPFPGCDSDLERPNLQNEPYVTVNPSNRDHIVVMWQTRFARGFVVAVTFDGGVTWETSTIPGLSRCTGGETGASDPWLAFATNGDLHSVALIVRGPEGTTSRIVVNKSVDGGLTWSDPVTLGQLELPRLEDKPTIAADPFDECTLYVGWTRFDDELSASNSKGEVAISRTTDCGQTWSDPQTLLRSDITGIGFQTVVLPDGTVLAFFKENVRTFSIPHSFYVMRSADRGETWPEEPVLVATARTAFPNLPDGEDPIRPMGSLFDVAVDRATGRLAAVWEDTFSEDYFAKPKIAFTLSNDGGQTWSEPVRIDQTPLSEAELLNQAIIPSVEISDDGTIGVTYYNFENDTPDMLPSETDYWFIHCHPDAADCADPASWANPVRMTSEPFDMSIALPAARGLFLGDYMGLTSSGSDFFAAFTVTRPTEDQNILFAPIVGR